MRLIGIICSAFFPEGMKHMIFGNNLNSSPLRMVGRSYIYRIKLTQFSSEIIIGIHLNFLYIRNVNNSQ